MFLGSKITADGDCSHKIKRLLFLGRKVMTNLDRSWDSNPGWFVPVLAALRVWCTQALGLSPCVSTSTRACGSRELLGALCPPSEPFCCSERAITRPCLWTSASCYFPITRGGWLPWWLRR